MYPRQMYFMGVLSGWWCCDSLLGLLLSCLLHLGRKVRHLPHFSEFNHVAILGRATPGPIDGFLFGIHLDDPEAADDFLGLDEGSIDDGVVAPGEGHARPSGQRVK